MGQERRLLIAEHFQFDPIGAGVIKVAENLAAQPSAADGVGDRMLTAGRVG
jgi:hypothetical protein